MHGGPSRERDVSNYHIHVEPDQLRRQSGQTIIAPLGISPLDDEVPTFDVSERRKPSRRP